jgi:N-acetyl-gamma-glutamyl-phosphate reductase
MIKTGIIGASGYSGLELVKILLRHPEAEIVFVAGTSRVAGQKLAEVFPTIRDEIDLEIKLTEINEIIQSDVNCLFLATPNETSLELIPKIMRESNKKIIDLSGAFRLGDNTLYPVFYGFENDNLALLEEAAYGLPELNSERIRKARLVANPGCYPTSVIIPMAPLLSAELIEVSQRIIIDSKSGVSGAGRKPTETTHYVEANESLKAYNIHKHRHEPEIKQELSIAADKEVKISFTPHLIPVNRGILSTIYATLKPGVTRDDIYKAWNQAYNRKKFVRVLEPGALPEIKFVAATPYCDIWCSVREDELIIVSCIDNLLKGASSQAIQNFNLLFGFKEELAL